MPFVPRSTKEKEKSSYKTMYLSDRLILEINRIAAAYETSFNNVVVSMIEDCLKDRESSK